MGGNIYNLEDFRKNSVLKQEGGYNLVPAEMIKGFFESQRGSGPDLFVVVHYPNGKDAHTLMRGWIPPTPEKESDYPVSALADRQALLLNGLSEHADKARLELKRKSSVYQAQLSHGYNVLLLRSRDGVIGCGWYDNAHTEYKGFRLAAFMLYALGILNADRDPVFGDAAYRYLPYAGDGLLNTEEADRIIFRVLGKLVAESHEDAHL